MRRDHSGLDQHICTIRANSKDSSTRISVVNSENGRYSNMLNQARKCSQISRDNLNLTLGTYTERVQSAVDLNLGSAQSQLISNNTNTGNIRNNTTLNPMSAGNKINTHSKMNNVNLKFKNANEFFKKQRDDAKKAKADEYLSHCMKNTEETLGHVLSKIKSELSDNSKTLPKAKSPSSQEKVKLKESTQKEKGKFSTMEHVRDTYEIEENDNFINSGHHKKHEDLLRKANSMIYNDSTLVKYTSGISQQDKIITELNLKNETLEKHIHQLERQLSSIYEKYDPFIQTDFQYEVLKTYSLDNSKWLLIKRKGKEINGTATSNYYWAMESNFTGDEFTHLSTAGKSLNDCEENYNNIKSELTKKEKALEESGETIKVLDSEIRKLKCENTYIKNSNEEYKNAMNQELVKSQEESLKLKWQNQDLLKDIERMNKEINSIPHVINEEMGKVKVAMNKSMKEGMSSKIGKLKHLLEQASNEKKLLEQKLIQSSDDGKKINRNLNVDHTIEICYTCCTKIHFKITEVKDLTQSIEKEKEKESVISGLKSQLNSLIVDNDRMRKVHKEVEKNFINSLNEKNSTIEGLQEELKDITMSRDSIYNKLQEVENELNLHISNLNMEIANKEAQWKEQTDSMTHSHSITVEQMQRTIDDLLKELEFSKLETTSSKKLVNDLKYLIEIKDTASNENYEKQIQELKGKLQEQSSKYEEVISEKDMIISQVKKENDDISSKYKGVNIKIKEKDNQIQDCVNKIDWYEENLREHERKILSLKNWGKSLAIDNQVKLTIQGLHFGLYSNESKILKLKFNYEEEIQKYESQIENLKEIAISKEEEIQLLKTEFEIYKEEMENGRIVKST